MVRLLRVLVVLAAAVALAACGEGAIEGTVSITGPGVPGPNYLGVCKTNAFSFAGTATGTVSNYNPSTNTSHGYTGQLTINATGSGCDWAYGGGGTLTASANSSGGCFATFCVTCPTLTGNFNRSVTNVTVVVNGLCTISDSQGSQTLPTTLSVLASEFIPAGTNSSGNVNSAIFAGEFTADLLT